jgi:hypothetical protein
MKSFCLGKSGKGVGEAGRVGEAVVIQRGFERSDIIIILK